MTLQPGMVFVVKTGRVVSNIINFCQKVKAVDNKSFYTHAGIIVGSYGKTFEALAKVGYGHIDHHKGCPILIVKHNGMTEELFKTAFDELKYLDGSMYPVPRLFLHLLGLAKFIHWKYPVCSELVAKLEHEAGLRRNWWGINPDNLADEWLISKHYTIIYQGKWEGHK